MVCKDEIKIFTKWAENFWRQNPASSKPSQNRIAAETPRMQIKYKYRLLLLLKINKLHSYNQIRKKSHVTPRFS